MTLRSFLHSTACLGLLLAAPALFGADVTITTTASNRIIPISLSGYSSEVRGILEFDLEMAGFEVVSKSPQYALTGEAAGNVKGTLTDSGNQNTVFARVYPGGTTRVQAHALADDVVKTLTGRPGIARTKLAFKIGTGQRNEAGQYISEIHVSDYDGANVAQLTQDRSIVAAPNWVPGQFKLYYASYRGGSGPAIYSHDLTTGSRSVIANFSGSNISPAVSPDGTQVAMILSKSGSPDLWVANADGGNLRQLTRSRGTEASPTWSPDGQTICFVSDEPGRPALYTIPAAGGPMQRLSTGGVVNCTEPDWAPDGQSIAFTRATGEFTIFVVPAGGGAAKSITAGEDPTWAPNSRTLAFVRGKGTQRRLSLLDVPTGRVKDVARVPGNCSQPSWGR